MKTGILMRLILPVLGLMLLSGCEKHSDESYFKSKSTAQINGQSIIDQTNVKYIFSPVAQITPFLKYYDEGLSHFMSHLKTERDGELKYMVDIYPAAESAEELHSRCFEFGKKGSEIDYNEYIIYCMDNLVSYALVNGEIVEDGSMQLTSYNPENGEAHGVFSLTFSEGTLTGEFHL